MRLSKDEIEEIGAALRAAAVQARPKLVDTQNNSPHAWWSNSLDKHTLRFFESSDKTFVAYPDGTVALLSRDEDEVAEFRMLYELQR